MFPYHILVTLDRNYLKVLSVMLYSLSQSDPEGVYTVYVVNNTLTEEDFASLSALLPRTELVNVQVPEDLLQNAPVSDRYPTEMYYRLFAARYLPQQLERILYLDPDLVVLHSLRSTRLTLTASCLLLPPTSKAAPSANSTAAGCTCPSTQNISIPV